jgi:hypothetical protein
MFVLAAKKPRSDQNLLPIQAIYVISECVVEIADVLPEKGCQSVIQKTAVG